MAKLNSKWLMVGGVAAIAVVGATYQALSPTRAADATNPALVANAGTSITVYKSPT